MELIAANTILGLSEGAFITLVTSVIGLAGLISVAIINTRRTRRTAERVTDTLGEKPQADDHNESMTVVQMLEKVLEGQAGQDNRLAAHDALHAAHDRRLDDHHRRLTEAEQALLRLHGKDAA